jgi:hypothetical protein
MTCIKHKIKMRMKQRNLWISWNSDQISNERRPHFVFSWMGNWEPIYFIQENTKIIIAKIAKNGLWEFLIFFIWIVYLLKILCYLK